MVDIDKAEKKGPTLKRRLELVDKLITLCCHLSARVYHLEMALNIRHSQSVGREGIAFRGGVTPNVYDVHFEHVRRFFLGIQEDDAAPPESGPGDTRPNTPA